MTTHRLTATSVAVGKADRVAVEIVQPVDLVGTCVAASKETLGVLSQSLFGLVDVLVPELVRGRGVVEAAVLSGG